MQILLPPSESKATRNRGASLDLTTLVAPELAQARERVMTAVAVVSTRPDAAEVLAVSGNLTDEIARNTRITGAPSLPAIQLYTGVLYDALAMSELTGGDKTRANRRILISSALYGVVRPADRLAPYRLSMGVNLPGVGPLASFWKQHLDAVMPQLVGDGLIVDCRSSTYAASWSPAQNSRWVHIRVPGATHMAKHTRGLLTRHLVMTKTAPRTVAALQRVAQEAFDTTLHEPKNARSPWILDVSVRPCS